MTKTQTHEKEKKKPKGFKPGSRKGQIVQGLSDKIKEAKEKGFAWLSHPAPPGCYADGMWRLKIELPTEENIPEYGKRGAEWAFLRCKRGIRIYEIHDYKGERLVAFTSNPDLSRSCYRTIDFPDIMAIVVEKHPVPVPINLEESGKK